MKALIPLTSAPVQTALRTLLADKTTKKNIIWATDSYAHLGPEYADRREMTLTQLAGRGAAIIEPRSAKHQDAQSARTKKKAEVFSPAWLVNVMNNHCDADWFGRSGVFNTELEQDWRACPEPVAFEAKKPWTAYVDSRRMEITCGEAPFLVSRYDAATGEPIGLSERVGMLDRKLRVVTENTESAEEWLIWATRALQSVYGYELQGDNLLIARVNVLMSFIEYYEARFQALPPREALAQAATVISWNLWQMDGLTGTVPHGKAGSEGEQVSVFELLAPEGAVQQTARVQCRVRDWRAKKTLLYSDLRKETRE